MRTRLGRLLPALAAAAVLAPVALTAGATASAAHGHDPSAQFVVRKGSDLFLGGRPYRFVGSNNYYPMYKSPKMVDAVLEKAAESDFQVMRLWGSADIGDPSGTVTDKTDPGYTLRAPNEGVYMQYWDAAAGRPAYNDGPNGLQRMDYILAKAKDEGLRVVIPFVNNWNDFGGMDQYVQWGGKQFHDDFYTDPTIRGWYKDWIYHYLNRTNTITGVKYKDDPTIMMWELGNEPRCLSAGAKPRSENCTTDTIVEWADEMTTYIKSIDKKHLVGVGDEGFYNKEPSSPDWTRNGADGVDSIRLSSLPNVDVMSFHLYPDHWSKDAAWGTQWITEHVKDAKKVGKASFLGEFGWQDKATRNTVYKTWLDAFLKGKGDGALYWILSDIQDDDTLYPDYDGYTVYCPSPVCTTISNFGKALRHVAQVFPPSADVDAAVTEFNAAASIPVLSNDVTWAGRTLKKKSVDLDPATAGRQVSYSVAGGTFAVSDLAVVTFTPVADFVGLAKASYTVDDSSSRKSNVAAITVTVKPDPTGALPIFTFEDGTQGWAEASFDARGATVTQTADWASQGTSSGRFSAESQGWYTSNLPAPLDLTGKVSFKFDLHLNAAGTGPIIALQFGDSWTWCQASVSWANGDPAGVTLPVDISLLSDLGCSAPDLTKLQAVNVFLHGGTFEIDNVRAE